MIVWSGASCWNGRRMATGRAKSPFDCCVFFLIFPLQKGLVEIYQNLATPMISLKIKHTQHCPWWDNQVHHVGIGGKWHWAAAEDVLEEATFVAIIAKVKLESEWPLQIKLKKTKRTRCRPWWVDQGHCIRTGGRWQQAAAEAMANVAHGYGDNTVLYVWPQFTIGSLEIKFFALLPLELLTGGSKKK